MGDYQVFGPLDIQKVGVVCDKCKTEVVYDLSAEHPAGVPAKCPICFDDPFTNERNANFVNYYRKIRKLEKPELTRLYFTKKETKET
jgi:hypothetical protein